MVYIKAPFHFVFSKCRVKLCYSVDSAFYLVPVGPPGGDVPPIAVAASAESFDHCQPRQPITVLALTAAPSSLVENDSFT